MSAATGSNTETIFVRLLNEGTEVYRPTNAIAVGKDTFRLVSTDDYDCDDETWEFLPGDIVSFGWKILSGNRVRIAVAKV